MSGVPEHIKQQWLDGESKWTTVIGKGWKAQRVLGAGGYGIVGHWKYTGGDRNEARLGDVCVKQSAVGSMVDLSYEARMYELFRESRTKHIVKMYRSLCEDFGQGSTDQDLHLNMDPKGQPVHRIFLEYCANGDLDQWVRATIPKRKLIKEDYLWGILHCLALACYVCEWGTEDLSSRRMKWAEEIVHLDIKSENVFVSANTYDVEHTGRPVFKLADFGLSINVSDEPQTATFWRQTRLAGTPPFLLPEQLKRQVKNKPEYNRPWNTWPNGTERVMIENREYHSAGNVWQVGLMMFDLMHRNRKFPYADWDVIVLGELGEGKETLYYEDTPSSPYSKTLERLIRDCLRIQQKERPSTTELVFRTHEMLETLTKNRLNGRNPLEDPLVINSMNPEPFTLPERWMEGWSEEVKRVFRKKEDQWRNTPQEATFGRLKAKLGAKVGSWVKKLVPNDPNALIPGLSNLGFDNTEVIREQQVQGRVVQADGANAMQEALRRPQDEARISGHKRPRQLDHGQEGRQENKRQHIRAAGGRLQGREMEAPLPEAAQQHRNFIPRPQGRADHVQAAPPQYQNQYRNQHLPRRDAATGEQIQGQDMETPLSTAIQQYRNYQPPQGRGDPVQAARPQYQSQYHKQNLRRRNTAAEETPQLYNDQTYDPPQVADATQPRTYRAYNPPQTADPIELYEFDPYIPPQPVVNPTMKISINCHIMILLSDWRIFPFKLKVKDLSTKATVFDLKNTIVIKSKDFSRELLKKVPVEPKVTQGFYADDLSIFMQDGGRELQNHEKLTVFAPHQGPYEYVEVWTSNVLPRRADV